jgi:aminoglycoside phosphotransferase (APT) family kinase protein
MIEGLAMTEAGPIIGYDIEKVEAWARDHVTSLTPPFNWTRLEGGHSNLTYMLEDAEGRKAVIRRPPMGELLPKAHDMEREWTVLKGLGPTNVPVPAAYGFCDDLSVTGARFYIMGHVNGRPLYKASDTEAWVPQDKREQMAYSFFEALADMHALDPDEVGLGELGKRENYIGRQLSTWYKSWLASAAPAQYDDPRAHSLQKFFLENIPEQGPARLVHGDYGLHNCLIGEDSRVAAVVDWEVSTLGDPLADLAYALNAWPDPTDAAPPSPEAATAPAGFPSRTQLAQRYAERTGRDLSHLDYYFGFNRWKTACIIHGVYARYLEGKKSTQGVDLEGLKLTIERSLTASQAAVDRLLAKA